MTASRIAASGPDRQDGPPGAERAQLDVSVLIVSSNTRDLLRDCLKSVFSGTRGIAYEVICVDNASNDGSASMVREEFPQVLVIANGENAGFVRANNQAIGISRGRYILLLNSDTVVLGNAIAETVRHADDNPKCAVATCRVLNHDMTLQRNCSMYPSPRNMLIHAFFLDRLFPKSRFFGRQFMTWWDFSEAREVETAYGCFSLVRKSAIEQVGMMDPVYYFYGDDPDWCYRFHEAGWKILFTPAARIVHWGGKSTKDINGAYKLQLYGSMLIFVRLHRGYAAFLLCRLLVAMHFLAQAPYRAFREAASAEEGRESLVRAGTCIRGFLLALTRWQRLVMNPSEVEARFEKGRGHGNYKRAVRRDAP